MRVFQPTASPVNDNLVDFLLVLNTCRQADADRVTAVISYFGCACQNRPALGPSAGRSPLARISSGICPHTPGKRPFAAVTGLRIRTQYSFLITKKEPRITPASFDF
jgi:N-terminal domain of ribose phosphate pyrophosphokinase